MSNKPVMEGDPHNRQRMKRRANVMRKPWPMRYDDIPRVRDGALRFTANAVDEQTPILI